MPIDEAGIQKYAICTRCIVLHTFVRTVSEKGKKFFVVTNKKLNSTGRGKSGETPFSDFVQAFNAFNKKLKQRESATKEHFEYIFGKAI